MKTKQKIIAISLGVGLIAWMVDAVVHYLFFYEASFWNLLITDVPAHDLWGRSAALVTFVLFGILLSRTIAQEQQQASLLRVLLDNIPDPIYVKDRDDRFTAVSRTKADHWQTTVKDMIGKTDHDLFTEAEAEAAWADDQQVMETGEPIVAKTEQITHPDGSERWYSVSKVPYRDADGQIIGVLGISRDITEGKQAEEKVRSERDRAQTYLDIAGVMLATVDADGNITLINKKGCEILGYRQEELIGKNWFDTLVPERMRDEIRGVFNRLMTGEVEPVEYYENPLVTNDTEERLIEFHNTVITGQTGQITGVLFSGNDITERKQAEEALRQETEQQAILLSSIPAFVYFKDSESKLITANRAFAEMVGIPVEELGGKDAYDLFPKEQAEKFHIDDRKVMETGRPLMNTEEQFTDTEGETRWASTSKVPYFDNQGKVDGMIGVTTDITDRKRAEQALQQAQKMEAIGVLAAGVAHDFNNILQTFVGRASLMLTSGDFDANTNEDLQDMVHVGQRGASLVQRLLTFSRQAESRKQIVYLGKSIDDARRILERTLSKLITIEADVPEDLRMVEADPYQIEQVLLNLGINAAEAMPDGGQFTITAENYVLAEEDSPPLPQMELGPYVLITVFDTGVGTDEGTLSRVFDPFYTTKGRSEHSGLGLAVAHGIVESHHGYIRAASQSGVGTTFSIYLPAVSGEEAEIAEREGEAMSAAAGGPVTVLVVDDEPAVARLACDMFEHYGHHAFKALDGEEAVELFQAHHEEIDLVLLDLVMPEMDGEECLERLREIDAQVVVVIATGYVIDEATRERLEPRVKGFLTKPFDIQSVAGTVSKAVRQH